MSKCISLSALSLACLIGCTPVPSDNLPSNTDIAVSDNTKLTEAAVSASKSLARLAQIEQAVHPDKPITTPPNPSSYGMGQLVSVDWSGPIGPIIDKVASASGYHVRVLGNAPSIPVIISVAAHNIPLGDVLSNIGYQAGNRADVVVFPSTHTITLKYTA
ncbi:MAG: LuxR family transcriptional regulator [marine bacterium B5-7]|nr:MAG: LuxR family transcriptional regulator [marine bacterium B5-7]